MTRSMGDAKVTLRRLRGGVEKEVGGFPALSIMLALETSTLSERIVPFANRFPRSALSHARRSFVITSFCPGSGDCFTSDLKGSIR